LANFFTKISHTLAFSVGKSGVWEKSVYWGWGGKIYKKRKKGGQEKSKKKKKIYLKKKKKNFFNFFF